MVKETIILETEFDVQNFVLQKNKFLQLLDGEKIIVINTIISHVLGDFIKGYLYNMDIFVFDNEPWVYKGRLGISFVLEKNKKTGDIIRKTAHLFDKNGNLTKDQGQLDLINDYYFNLKIQEEK